MEGNIEVCPRAELTAMSHILRPSFSPPPRHLSYGQTVRLLLERSEHSDLMIEKGKDKEEKENIGRRREVEREGRDSGKEGVLVAPSHQRKIASIQSSQSSSGSKDKGLSMSGEGMSLFGGSVVLNNFTFENNKERPSSSSLKSDTRHAAETRRSHKRPASPSSSSVRSSAATLDRFLGIAPPERTTNSSPAQREEAPHASYEQGVDKRKSSSSSAYNQSTVKDSTSLHPLTSSKASFSLSSSLSTTQGLQSVCRNIAASPSSLSAFKALFSSSSSCALAVVYPDGSSSHASSAIKYCTPSIPCDRWYCACDRNIRAAHALRHPLEGVVFALQISDSPHSNSAYFLPLETIASNTPISYDDRVQILVQVLSSAQTKCIYNLQVALLPLLLILPSSVQICNVFDPRIAAYLCNSNIVESNLELDHLLYSFRRQKATSMIQSSGESLSILAKSVRKIFQDLLGVIYLQAEQSQKLASHHLMDLFKHIEIPLVPVLTRMELTGIGVDRSRLQHIEDQVQALMENISRQAIQVTGRYDFNMSSPEQVADLLYRELALPAPVQQAKQKHASTSEEDLQKIASLHPVVNLILQHVYEILPCLPFMNNILLHSVAF